MNEDPNVKLIRELRDEISKLKALMFSEQRSDMLAQLQEKEAREKVKITTNFKINRKFNCLLFFVDLRN